MSRTKGSLGGRLALGAALLVPVFLWRWHCDSYIPWGDDWAGYLLQARALAAGAPERELITNATVISLSDVYLGPFAYPWGYPAMLALVGPLVDWDIGQLKIVGLASLFCLCLTSYWIARRRFGRLGAAAIAVLATTQTSIIDASLVLLSDLPYAAVAMAALGVADRQYLSLLASRAPRLGETVALAALCVAAFTMRPNGVVLPFAFVGANAVAAAITRDVQTVAKSTVVFGLLVAAGVAIYFRLLPDGSLVHVSALSMDPRVWVSRMQDHAVNVLQVLPGGAFSRSISAVASALLAALSWRMLATGGWQRVSAAVGRGRSLVPIVLFVAAHLALLTMFRGNTQGLRYYVSIVAPLTIIFAFAAREVLDASQLPGLATRTSPTPMVTAAAVLICLGTVLNTTATLRARRNERDQQTGPYSEATQRMAHLVAALPADKQVSFRKPRALRYLTGRVVLAVCFPENLPLVDVYVWERGSTEGDQVTEAHLIAAGFTLTSELPPFRIYEASRNNPRGNIAASVHHD